MIPLALHSHYSLLRGTASPRELCRAARGLGYTSLALTDIDNLYGLWDFLAACREHEITPIIGAEIRDPHTPRRAFALVENDTGYRNLCRLLTARHLDPAFQLSDALSMHGQGLILLIDDPDLLHFCRNAELACVAALCTTPNEHNSRLRRLAEQLDIAAVAVADCYFFNPEAHRIHLLLRAIARNTTLTRVQELDAVGAEHHLAAPADYYQRFAIWPQVVRNTLMIAERCTFRGPNFGLVLPPCTGIARSADEELRYRAFFGARSRYGDKLPDPVVSRLEHELKIIAQMDFSSYFLVVHDIVGRHPRTCGRGSGAASLVAYCLRITNVCPVKHNLYFERFLNPGRTDAPDIDIDFAWDERDNILADVLAKHAGHAAMVCNHVFFQPRMAVRETAKVFGLPEREITRFIDQLSLSRYSPKHGTPGTTAHPEPWSGIQELSKRITGMPRYLSVHPGGVIITPRPISDYVPVQRANKEVPIIQWEKDGAEKGGLVKIDLLGNRSLGVIRDALGQLRDNGALFDENSWEPEDDPATQKTVAKGRTMGCFYIESPAMRLLQEKAAKGDFEHLVIHSSIIRPAANELIREYLRRLHGGEWQPLHPILKGVLDESYGIMVYQEDVSRVAVKFGFSPSDGDRLRKIMSKKDKEKTLLDYRERFFTCAQEQGVAPEIGEEIWQMMLSFQGYSFCKPHSASYAKVSFQAAYLKTHYPAEFMAAVISNRGGYYSTFAYVSEARRLGLTIKRPDVNVSRIHWHGKGKELRVGLMAVKHLSRETMERIVAARTRGVFVSAEDFFERIGPDEQEARSLIQAGALDAFAPGNEQTTAGERTPLLWLLAHRQYLGATSGQAAPKLFREAISIPRLPPEDPLQRLRNEYRILGFLCAHHPIMLFQRSRKRLNTLPARTLLTIPGQKVRFLGWFITGKVVGTKQGKPMEFLTFEDETGPVECTFFPEVYLRHRHLLHRDGPLLLEGTMEADFGVSTLNVARASLAGT